MNFIQPQHMPRSSNKQIEEDEHKVIQQLMEDGRQSPHEIAEKCGFSRQKVWRIINRLEEDNRVWGYTAVIDEETAGRNTYFALVKAKAPFFEIIEKLIKRTKDRNAEVEVGVTLLYLQFLNGLYDWIIIFSTNDIRHAKRFCAYIQKHYETHVERVDLLENVFPLIKFGKINPNIEQLKEFAIA